MLRKTIETRLRKSGPDEGLGDFTLSFLERLYAKATEKRNRDFDAGKKVQKLSRPVISIGNLVAGGTGKTPMARAIARILSDMDFSVAILSRGYGGKYEKKGGRVSDGKNIFLSAREAGDEPYLLAKTSPASVYVGRERYRSGLQAVKDGAEILLLDDGFQHRRLYRDLDILLMDAKMPLGNGRLLPRGLLRESPWGINRGDALVFTRSESSSENPLEQIKAFTRTSFAEKTRCFQAGESLLWCNDCAPDPGEKILAFSGIADPGNFFQSLQEKGFELKAFRAFPDHHRYGKKDLFEILSEAETLKVGTLVTTAKDAVKIPEDFFSSFNLYVADVAPVFFDAERFEHWLREKVFSILGKKGGEPK
ncbi:tetraacyldisaccharide 4'-kinase [Desulfococcaceae bacterium OttesenSCG-928-F15]|nr:tetraacyldisaccharide 4'-kinase [Desulfococcaceae bacterium OttesenSCG-928-F15]